MAIVQLSILRPREGEELGVDNLLQALDLAFAQEEGYVLGLRFRGLEGGRETGRIFVWESEVAASKAAASGAQPIIQRLEELCEARPEKRSYELEGYALRPE